MEIEKVKIVGNDCSTCRFKDLHNKNGDCEDCKQFEYKYYLKALGIEEKKEFCECERMKIFLKELRYNNSNEKISGR